MWPFENRKRKTIEQLARFISPAAAEAIVNNPNAGYPLPYRIFIGHQIIQFRDNDTEKLNETISQAMEIIMQAGGIVSDKPVSLLIAVFGAPVGTQFDPAETSKAVALQLITQFPTDIKIVFGSGEVLFGSWGHASHMFFGPMFPFFSHRVERLCQMQYGQVEEMPLGD